MGNQIKTVPLRPFDGKIPRTGEELSQISEKRWIEAERRKECLLPLLREGRTREMVEKRAKKYGYGISSIYRWLAAFSASNDITTLIPSKPDGGAGQLKVHPVFREILLSAKEQYLSTSKLPITKIIGNCQLACRLKVREIEKRNAERRRTKNKLKPGDLEDVPKKNSDAEYIHANTIRYQLNLIPQSEVDSARLGNKGTRKHLLNKGELPKPELPLEVIQIDHTKMDIGIVDDEYRKSIGRVWLTAAVDVWSRVVCGYCISLEPVGTLTTGVCLGHSILSKDKWLIDHNIPVKWPVYGKPRTILVDNAMEFCSESWVRACGKHGIQILYRPLKQPQYAGHIESFMKTIAYALKGLPGSTFSSVDERGETKFEELAAFTFSELERWMALLISEYNNTLHGVTHMRPVVKFLEGIDEPANDFQLGKFESLGDPEAEALLIDFLPAGKPTTVQKYGIRFNHHKYSSADIESYVCQKDPHTRKSKKYTFKYDPRDMSAIYFYGPQEHKYFKLKTPSARFSLWEVKDAVKQLKLRGYKSKELTQEVVDQMILDRKEIEDQAALGTQKARRNTQRRKENSKKSSEYVKMSDPTPAALQYKPDPKKKLLPFSGLQVNFDS